MEGFLFPNFSQWSDTPTAASGKSFRRPLIKVGKFLFEGERMSVLTTRKFCKHCKRETECDLSCNIAQNGAIQIFWYCLTCKQNAQVDGITFIAKEKVIKYGIKLESIPVVNDYRIEKCAVCGKAGVELHHYAPKHLFPNDAENWPTGWLCKEHHSQWHSIVTPNMGKRGSNDHL